MAKRARPPLSPRKKPRQSRSSVTLDAIFEATIQLLIGGDLHRLTTTRVAQRAGVSIGSLYQYFPNKQSLVYALNERYLHALADKIVAVCESRRGAPIGDMVEALIEAYWHAKTERAEVTRALYRSVAELDHQPLIDAFASRIDAATSTMLSSASDATFPDVSRTTLTLLTVIFGAVRSAFERDLPPSAIQDLKRELVFLCRSYLAAAQLAKRNDEDSGRS